MYISKLIYLKNVQIQKKFPRVLIEKFILLRRLWQMFLASMSWVEINLFLIRVWVSLGTQMVKNPPAMHETRVLPVGWEDPPEMEWSAIPVVLHGEFHGQRSLVEYSPWGLKESDDWLTNIITFLLEYRMSKIGYHCEKYDLLTSMMNTRNDFLLV